MPGDDGQGVLRQLRLSAPTVPVVVVSASERTGDVRASMKSGAAGYIPKTLGLGEMLAALRRILNGDVYVPAHLLAALSSDGEKQQKAPDQAPVLTGRQREVLLLLAAGQPNKVIARRLGVAEGTVKLHVSALMRAFGTGNRTETVLAAQRSGLVD